MTKRTRNSTVGHAPPTRERSRISRYHVLGGAALIAGAICLTYFPALHGGFLMDDDHLLTANNLVKSPDGLYRIWFTTEPFEYYPISYSSFWVQWRLWGKNSTGYHAISLALHISAALLIWAILRKLTIPGAFLAALLFAVHPVNVESAGWIAQQRNMLAMLFFLFSIFCYLFAEEDRKDTSKKAPLNTWFWLSLMCFVLAMLSKGSVAIAPLVLLLIVWWQRRRLTAGDLLRTAPFFLIAAAFTCMNIWFQTHGDEIVIRSASFSERLAGAGAVVWFYLSTALAPINLLFVYPPWRVQIRDPIWWLPLAAILAVSAGLWWRRNALQANWIRPLLFAWSFYCVALLPVLGFADVGFMQYSLVADHYQHIAIIGVAALVAAALTVCRQHSQGAARSAVAAAMVLPVVLLMALTHEQSLRYGNPVELYQTTLLKNPDSWLAHVNLGRSLKQSGRLLEAIDQYRQSLTLKADADTYINLGNVLEALDRFPEAITQYQHALALKPDDALAHNSFGVVLAKTGQLREAIAHYELALLSKPDFTEAHYNLGLAFIRAGRPQEALDQFQRVLQLEPSDTAAAMNIALTCAQLNRPVEAISAAQKALDLARSQGQRPQAQEIENWLRSYRSQPNLPSSSIP